MPQKRSVAALWTIPDRANHRRFRKGDRAALTGGLPAHLEEPIKTVGTRMVEVEVSPGVIAPVKTMVVEEK